MKPYKIVIAGGPGTGKTSIINRLKALGYTCYDEISRQVTLQAREEGIEQLFLTEPLLFSQKLLEGREQQYKAAAVASTDAVFIDRGLPDVLAYMDYIGDTYPKHFIDSCKTHLYDFVFVLPPWEAIFVSDSERYENFEQAKRIHDHLLATYNRFGYQLIDVPFGSVDDRISYILKRLNIG